jgi:hypothetical protein
VRILAEHCLSLMHRGNLKKLSIPEVYCTTTLNRFGFSSLTSGSIGCQHDESIDNEYCDRRDSRL